MTNTYKNALIVEDDDDLRGLLTNILKQKVSSVADSDSLTSAQQKIKEAQPDFILLDNNLPDGRGLDYIKTFKALCPSVNIVIISALPNLKEEAFLHGADGYLEKPLRISDINSFFEEAA